MSNTQKAFFFEDTNIAIRRRYKEENLTEIWFVNVVERYLSNVSNFNIKRVEKNSNYFKVKYYQYISKFINKWTLNTKINTVNLNQIIGIVKINELKDILYIIFIVLTIYLESI